ncbi:hypothetical protein T12_6247 [Trichinella patagoniensis]|uniref:Uncharacterized protein n=1 Tax=Trichinella patagoniensis TaxID=990121 RepID=A0A0V0ZAJ0_9BILA|nr:hypothetical protein T12_6247 [Trichinella patagoniensis]
MPVRATSAYCEKPDRNSDSQVITDCGRHEADRGPHEADRGRHEAVKEKTKFLGPQFCRSGIGILRKGEVIP